MNPEFTKIHVDRKTHKVSATLKWHDGSEKVYTSEDLRYRLGNCAEVNESEDAYQMAIQNIANVEAFIEHRSAFAKALVSLRLNA